MKLLSLFGTAGLLVVVGTMAMGALPEAMRQPSAQGSQDVFEEKPTTSVVGGFRTTLAGYLFAKSHEYLHGGVVMRPATQAEIAQEARIASHGDQLKDHHGVGETTGVPEPERDVRGVWGTVERQTQPFMDIRHHGHRDASEALPLFRMMTWSDPHFVEAYSMGAHLVFSGVRERNVEKALEFLDEGIANNPDAYVLRADAGGYNFYNLKRLDHALEHYRAAASIIERTPDSKLDLLHAEQTWGAMVQVYRRSGDRENEIAFAHRGLRRFPTSAPCRVTFRRYGLPLPPDVAAK